MGEWAQFKEVHNIVPPNFNNGIYASACVVDREEVLTLRREEWRSQKAFRGHVKNPDRRKRRPPLMEED